MRLSEAILLGSSLCKARAGGSDESRPSEVGGCALEMGLLANGIDDNWVEAAAVWPWLNGTGTANWAVAIGCRFDREVMILKRQSLEEFADWVRSIEPAEEEPIQANPELQTVEVRPHD